MEGIKTNCKSKDPEYVKMYNKKYYETNRQKRKEDDDKKNITLLCSCGKHIKTLGILSHKQTKYHTLYSRS